MSYEPTSENRPLPGAARRPDASAGPGASAAPANQSGGHSGIFDPHLLAKKYPHLQPGGPHAGFPPIPLHRAITLVGSRRTARVHLNSKSVSRAHALIVVTPHGVSLTDLHSREGTRVQGHTVKEIQLRENDKVEIGRFTFTFHDPRPDAAPAQVEPLALEVSSPAGPHRLVLEKRVTLIGQRSGSDLQLPFPGVSTANTAIVRLEGFVGESESMGFVGYAVFDLGGKGTLLGTRPVHKQRLNVGDELKVGPATLRLAPAVEAPARAAPAEAPAAPVRPAAAPPRPAALQPAAAPADADEILLDEGLTPEGIEEDVLTGSSVMPAITEPAAKERPQRAGPVPFAPETDVFGADDTFATSGEAEDTASLGADVLAADAEDEDLSEFPTRGWRSAPEEAADEPAGVAAEAPTEEPPAEEEALVAEAPPEEREAPKVAVLPEPEDEPVIEAPWPEELDTREESPARVDLEPEPVAEQWPAQPEPADEEAAVVGRSLELEIADPALSPVGEIEEPERVTEWAPAAADDVGGGIGLNDEAQEQELVAEAEPEAAEPAFAPAEEIEVRAEAPAETIDEAEEAQEVEWSSPAESAEVAPQAEAWAIDESPVDLTDEAGEEPPQPLALAEEAPPPEPELAIAGEPEALEYAPEAATTADEPEPLLTGEADEEAEARDIDLSQLDFQRAAAAAGEEAPAEALESEFAQSGEWLDEAPSEVAEQEPVESAEQIEEVTAGAAEPAPAEAGEWVDESPAEAEEPGLAEAAQWTDESPAEVTEPAPVEARRWIDEPRRWIDEPVEEIVDEAPAGPAPPSEPEVAPAREPAAPAAPRPRRRKGTGRRKKQLPLSPAVAALPVAEAPFEVSIPPVIGEAERDPFEEDVAAEAAAPPVEAVEPEHSEPEPAVQMVEQEEAEPEEPEPAVPMAEQDEPELAEINLVAEQPEEESGEPESAAPVAEEPESGLELSPTIAHASEPEQEIDLTPAFAQSPEPENEVAEAAAIEPELEYEEVAEAPTIEPVPALAETPDEEFAAAEAMEPEHTSALDLSDLGLEEETPAPAAQAPALSDEEFALQLEAMGDSRSGDLVEPAAAEEPAPALADSAFDDSLTAQAEASAEDLSAALQPPAETQADAAPAAAAEAPVPAPPATAKPPRQQKPRNWREGWAVEQSAFLGNLTPLDPMPSLPIGGMLGGAIPPLPPARAQPAARAQPSEPPEQNEPVEQAPEGLGPDYASAPPERPGARPSPRQPSRAAPPAPAAPAPTQHTAPAHEPVGAGAGSGSQQGPRGRGPAKGPKPKTVGFVGPVAEIEESVSRAAANPFSSSFVGGDSSAMLDPSAAMPETTEWISFPDVMAEPEPAPVQAAPTGAANAPPVAAAHVEAERIEPDRNAASNRLIADADKLGPVDEDQDELARVDEFVRTIRGGVRGGSGAAAQPAESSNGVNGHGPKGWEVNGLSAPADAPSTVPAALQRDIDPPRRERGRNTASARVGPVVPDALEAEQPRRGRKSTWMVPLLIGLMVATMIGAVAGIYYVMQPMVPVTLKLRYDISPTLPQQARVNYQEQQLQELLQPEMQAAALGALARIAPGVDPAYLGDPTAFNSFAVNRNNVAWSTKEDDTLLLSRTVPEGERQAEMARLKAVGTALHDMGGEDRAAREGLEGEVQALEAEIEKLVRQAEELGQDIEEAMAALAQAPASDEERARQEQELTDRIARLDEQWSSADRRVAAVKQQLAAHESSNPLAGDQRLAELKRQLTDVEARSAGSRQDDAGATAGAIPAAGTVDEPALPADPRELRALVETRISQLAAAAERLDVAAADALKRDVAVLNRLIAVTVDEVVPQHVQKAGEVELLRQTLLRTRRQRMIERLDADDQIRTLRGEVALKERELGAALSDGLEERAAGLRMALRLTRDRLTLRTSQIEAELEQDEQVAAARQALEAAEAEAQQTLPEQREAIESELAALRESIEASAGAGAAEIKAAVSSLEEAARASIAEQTRRLPVAARVWGTEPAAEPEAGEEEGAGEGGGNGGGVQGLSRLFASPWLAMVVAPERVGQGQDAPATQPASAEAIRRQIEHREAELEVAHATRAAELRQELRAAEAAAAKAQREAQEARAELANLRTGRQTAERDSQRLGQLRQQKDDLENTVDEKLTELERARARSNILATPRPPTDADLASMPGRDDRIMTIVVALVGITVVFLIGIFLAFRSDARV